MPAFQEIPPVWAPGATGTSFATAAVTAGNASAEAQIRTAAAANTPIGITLRAVVTTSAGVPGFAVAFGGAGMAAPVDTDWLILDDDGPQHFTLPVGVTHLRIKSLTGGSAGYVAGYLSGRPG